VRGLSQPSAEHLITHGVIHDADAQKTVHAKSDRDREERYALREIQTSADGIDDPESRGVNAQRLVFGPLLGEDRVAGTFLLEDRHDLFLDVQRRFHDDIALALPAEVSRRAETRQGGPTALEGGPGGDVEGLCVVHVRHTLPSARGGCRELYPGDGSVTSSGQERLLVRTIVCAYTQAELPTPWLAIFHRFERVMEKARLRIRVRLFPLEELPEGFEVLVVPPELQEAAEALQTGARIIVTTRAEAPAAADALLREIELGETLYAEKVRPGEPKIMTHRGGDIL